MAVKDISKIIIQGTPKQRIALMAEDNARKKYGQESLLSELEVKQLTNSFKKPNEVALWNKWYKVDTLLTGAIMNLQGLKYEVLMHYSNLRGYILVWDTIQEAEELSNHILHEIKNHKERIRIAQEAGKISSFLFSDIDVDPKEGYIHLNIDFMRDPEEPEKDFSLWYIMTNVNERAVNSAIKFISWREAILDFMEEEGFTIKAYKDMVKAISEEIYKPLIGWNKYRSDEKTFIPGVEKKRADKLKERYSIAPNISELKVDPEIYSYFKKEFLGLE